MPAAPATATRFERDTSLRRVDDGTYEGRIDPAWSVVRGPNGGYLAAIVLRAIEASVADAERVPRSMTVHFVSPPESGTVTIAATRERVGRSLTSCSARVSQDGRLVALALAACSAARPGPSFCDLPRPDMPAPDSIPPSVPPPEAPPIASRWETRWTIGSPPVPGAPRGEHAAAGGWIRPEEPQRLDAPAIAAVTDAWLPAIFTRLDERLFVPTIDLTVHFRSRLPHPGLAAGDFVFAEFRTTVTADGFMEEDGEVWAPDGTLLAQSRQLAATLALAD